MRILLVEDDHSLGSGLKLAISRDGHTVEWLQRGDFDISSVMAEAFELLILDLGLPGLDGLSLIKTIRASNNPVPILILTARDTVDDRIKGLDTGADDYLIKPFELGELKARIRALSRRNHGQADTTITAGDMTINTSTMEVLIADQPINLNRREYALLLELINHKGQVLTRERLETVLYGWDGDLESNALEVHIHHLRKKLPLASIATVRGVGYRLK